MRKPDCSQQLASKAGVPEPITAQTHPSESNRIFGWVFDLCSLLKIQDAYGFLLKRSIIADLWRSKITHILCQNERLPYLQETSNTLKKII